MKERIAQLEKLKAPQGSGRNVEESKGIAASNVNWGEEKKSAPQ